MASPGRQKSECEFCLFGGGFCARRAAPCAGLAVFARPAAVMRAFAPGACLPAVRFVCAFFSYLSPFPVWLFASQTSFHLSLMPRRAPHFLFGKKMGEKNREGSGAPLPFEPHSSALRPISPFLSLLAGLAALWAANRRLTGKRLKSQGAKLSFSSVSVRRGTPVPCGRSPLFSRCWPA